MLRYRPHPEEGNPDVMDQGEEYSISTFLPFGTHSNSMTYNNRSSVNRWMTSILKFAWLDSSFEEARSVPVFRSCPIDSPRWNRAVPSSTRSLLWSPHLRGLVRHIIVERRKKDLVYRFLNWIRDCFSSLSFDSPRCECSLNLSIAIDCVFQNEIGKKHTELISLMYFQECSSPHHTSISPWAWVSLPSASLSLSVAFSSSKLISRTAWTWIIRFILTISLKMNKFEINIKKLKTQ